MKILSSLYTKLESYKIRKDSNIKLSLYKDDTILPLKKKTFNFNSNISLLLLIKVIVSLVITAVAAVIIINKCREKKIIKKLEEKFLLVPIDKIKQTQEKE